MEAIQVLGFLAAILTTGANFPQTYKVIRTKSTKSLSTVSFIMLFSGSLSWVIYGFYRNDIPVILANGIAGFLHGIILFMKLKSKNK